MIVGGEDGGKIAGGIGRQLRATLLSPFVKQRLGFFLSSESRKYIQPLADLVEIGEVVPAITDQVALEDAPNAIRNLERGNVSGKVVIDVGAMRAG